MAAQQIRLTPVKETKDLSKFMATVLPADLRATLRQVSAFEIAGQIRIGNTPSAIIVDGQRKPIDTAMRRVVALFGSAAQLAAAMHEAFALLRQLTRRKSGRAAGSYRLLLNGVIVGDESAVDRVARNMTNKDSARIIGPLVPYGRKLYWNPATGGDAPRTRIKRKKRGEYRTLKGDRVKVYTKFREPIHVAAARMLARKYRALTIKDAWMDTPIMRGVGSDAGTPGLLIRMKAGRRARG